MGGSPSIMPNILHYFGLFFPDFSLTSPPNPTLLSPIPLHSISCRSIPPLPFSKKVNKKLTYRRHEALSIIKHMNAFFSEHAYYSCDSACSLGWPEASRTRRASCVRPSVCSFVRPL